MGRDQDANGDGVGESGEDEAVKGDGWNGKMGLSQSGSGKWHQGKPEQQLDIGPENLAVHPPGRLEQVVVVVPIHGEDHETEHIAKELGCEREKRSKVVPSGTRNSKTMITMMIAMTALPNASSRPLVSFQLSGKHALAAYRPRVA
jgi:hypothetical protein